MGKADAAVRNWLSDKRRFADLFNGVIFSGREARSRNIISCP